MIKHFKFSHSHIYVFLLCTSVHSSHYNKIPSTQCLINRGNLFLTVPEARESKTKALTDSVMCSPVFWFTGSCLLTVSSHGGRSRKVVLAFFIRALTPFMRPLLLWLDLPKAPLPNFITWGISFQHMNFREAQTFRLYQYLITYVMWYLTKAKANIKNAFLLI